MKEFNVLEFTKQEEGYRENAYYCPAGKLTIGYGWNLESNPPSAKELEILINGNSAQKRILFEGKLVSQLKNCELQCKARISKFSIMPEIAQQVLICMCFQMGIERLLPFKDTLNYIRAGKYKLASEEMLDSVWYKKETPKRAKKLSDILATLGN